MRKQALTHHHPLLHSFEISSVDPELLLLSAHKEEEETSICCIFFKHHISAHGRIGRIGRQSAITNCLFIPVVDSHQSLHADQRVYTEMHTAVKIVGSEKKERAHLTALSCTVSHRHASVDWHTRRNNWRKRKTSSPSS